MKYFGEFLWKIWKIPVLFCLCMGIMAGVFYLYELPLESVLYGALLCLLPGLLFFFYEYRVYRRKRENLEYVKQNLLISLQELTPARDKNEALYQQMLRELNSHRMKVENSRREQHRELSDYYTMWVHQIKTPISALRLLLSEDSKRNRESLDELFKIEQYVEMVLGYLRTEDISSDMNFSMCSLDKIVREQIHKYARIFIGKRITLEYDGVTCQVLTDAKWLGFVIGQVLSNGLKYTRSGKIAIYMSVTRPSTLVIEDTGIGVSKDELPRVFEKGFTGSNGRTDSHSTGIGLYLCAKIMKKLGHQIYMESVVGKGTKVYLYLERKRLDIY